MKIKVLLVQNSAIIGNKKATFDNLQTILEPYRGKRIDFIILPEVWSIGWYCQNFAKEAEILESSPSIDVLKDIAITYKTNVIGGSIILKKDNKYTNTCPVISRKGKIVTTYDKMHLFSHKGSEENKYITTGSELKILNYNGLKIGLTICYDIRFPEIYREYSKHGVQIFVNMAAWSNKKPEHWEIMHRARAIENQCYMLTVDQTGKITDKEYNLGNSMIINPWGDIEASLQSQEDCLLYEVDTAKVEELRENFPLISDRRDTGFKTFNYKEINLYD